MVDILMMGNSYLYRGNNGFDGNGPAEILERLTDAVGLDVNYTQSYLGNESLRGHWEDTDRIVPREELATGSYDVIVMAGSDDGISTQKTDDDTAVLAEYGKRFVDLARANGTQAVFYEPWVPDFAVSPTSDAFTPRISALYRNTAEANNAGYSPNATAYKQAYDAFYQRLGPDGTGSLVEDLLTFDGIHASPHGALLIASVLFGTIFGTRAPDFRPSGVSAEDADLLQDIAWESVQARAITLVDVEDTDEPTPTPTPTPTPAPPPADDKIEGTEGNDVLSGTAAADIMEGRGGRDELVSGDGNDRLDGGGGVDRAFGGSGDDVFVFDSRDTHNFGGSGNDTLAFLGGTSELDMRLVSMENFDLQNGSFDELILQIDDIRQAQGDLVIIADAGDVVRLETNQTVERGATFEENGEMFMRYTVGGSELQSFVLDADVDLSL